MAARLALASCLVAALLTPSSAARPTPHHARGLVAGLPRRSAPDSGAPLHNANFTTWLAPTYEVNLDLAPEERWNAVARALDPRATLGPDWVTKYLANSTHLSTETLELAFKVVGELESFMSADEARELRGYAKALGVEVGALAIANLAYELRKLGGPSPNDTMAEGLRPGACSGVVAEDASGRTYHGRNLDWNMPAEMLPLIYTCRFTKGGEVAFEGGCVLGLVGMLSGAKPGVGSANINERHLGGSPVTDALEAILRGAPPVAVALRRVFESATSYAGFKDELSTVRVAAPVYYIIAGPGPSEGAVLTRDREGVDEYSLNPDAGRWFLYQSNYDRWTAPPKTDDRRGYALRYLQSAGQGAVASREGVLKALDFWPVANPCTSQTLWMDSAKGTGGVQTYVRQYVGPGGCKTQT